MGIIKKMGILNEREHILAGEGEMAELIRTFDWSRSPLGAIQDWPQSLITTINIILNSKFPMFLWWGDDLIQFYNDAYRPSLGESGKHPLALGQKGELCWNEIWDIIKPLIDQVLITGKPTWNEDQLIPIFRNGHVEDVYWTFGYSAVYDESGKIKGVLVVCNETTQKTLNTKTLKENKIQLEMALAAVEISQLNFQKMVVQAPVAMCILEGPEFIVVVANKFMCEIWTKKKDEVINIPVFKIFPEAKQQGLETLLQSVYFSGERCTAYEMPLIFTRNGQLETVYLNFVYEALKNSEEKITGIMSIATDVTPQVLARMKIEESEQEFRLLADSLPHIVWTATPEGNVDYYNKQWYDFTEFIKEDGDEGWISIIHPDDVQLCLDKYINSIKTGEPYSIEYRFKDLKKGGYRWFLGKAQAIKDAEGKIIKWFGSCTDIDVQKSFSEKLEQKVTERTLELQKMNGELQNFAYVASHDLQEPMRKIQTYADRILQKDQPTLSDAGKEHFRRLQLSANRMQTLINDLLDYSRTNNSDFKIELIDLNILLEEVTSEIRDVISEKHAIIEINKLCLAHVIPFQFRQVVHNLLGNSLKFARHNIPPHIMVFSEFKLGKDTGLESLEEEIEYCHIRFSDNGIGFAPEYKTRIFEMFQRLNGRSEYEGTGIGLAIVNKIIENHKGVITANSELGKGATFDIYLPN